MRFRGNKSDKRKIKSKKIVIDGITFLSKLEGYMYSALKKANIKFQHEVEVFTLIEGFRFNSSSYERQSNSKGDMIDRGNKKVLAITYKPDFTSHDFIIECKGFPNESFNLRWKLFKRLLSLSDDNRTLYKPQTNKECDKVVRLILEKRKATQSNH